MKKAEKWVNSCAGAVDIEYGVAFCNVFEATYDLFGDGGSIVVGVVCWIDAIGSFRQMEIEINQINVIYGGSQLSHYDENAFGEKHEHITHSENGVKHLSNRNGMRHALPQIWCCEIG